MNIEKLKELIELSKLLEGEETTKNKYNEFIGKYVLVRGYYAGVWAGVLQNAELGNIVLTEARNLYRWWAKEGIGLSGIASYGLAKKNTNKILKEQKKIIITDMRVSTFFECTEEAEKSIREYKTAEQS